MRLWPMVLTLTGLLAISSDRLLIGMHQFFFISRCCKKRTEFELDAGDACPNTWYVDSRTDSRTDLQIGSHAGDVISNTRLSTRSLCLSQVEGDISVAMARHSYCNA